MDVGPINKVANNTFLKEKIKLNTTYKGYIIHKHSTGSVPSGLLGIFFIEV